MASNSLSLDFLHLMEAIRLWNKDQNRGWGSLARFSTAPSAAFFKRLTAAATAEHCAWRAVLSRLL